MKHLGFLLVPLALAACGVIDGLTGSSERPPDDGGTLGHDTADAGGTDAGSADAGSTDAGGTDGTGTDAGITDPGSTASSWTWRGPTRLDRAQTIVNNDSPALAVRPDGRLYAAWTEFDRTTGTSTLWLTTRGPGAFGWDAPKGVPAIPDAPRALFPQLAAGARGQALVAYLAEDAAASNRTSIRVARFDDSLTVNLSDIVRLDDASNSSPELNWAHSVAVDEEGGALVSWDDDERDYESVSAGGTLWSDPRLLDTTGTFNLPRADEAASRGQSLLAWTSSSGTFAQLASIADGTLLAGAPHPLAGAATESFRSIPRVALRGDTGLVVWMSAGSGLSWERWQNGSWRGAGVVAGATRVGDEVDLAMNAAGHAVAIWQQVPAGSTDMREANLYAATFDGSSWSAPQLVSLPGAHRMTWNIDVDMNEHGDALVVWTDFDAGGTYTRLWANLLRATPNAWSGPIAIDPESPQDRNAAQPNDVRSVSVVLQPDGSGATVVWKEEVSLDEWRVWENHLQ